MTNRRALQRNAADPQQVRFAERKARQEEELFLESLRAIMDTTQGRVVVWGLLERAGVYRSVWDNSARIHYNAGRQDYGHELLALLVEHAEEGYLLMETEARRRARYVAREAEAVLAAAEERSNGQ